MCLRRNQRRNLFFFIREKKDTKKTVALKKYEKGAWNKLEEYAIVKGGRKNVGGGRLVVLMEPAFPESAVNNLSII